MKQQVQEADDNMDSNLGGTKKIHDFSFLDKDQNQRALTILWRQNYSFPLLIPPLEDGQSKKERKKERKKETIDDYLNS